MSRVRCLLVLLACMGVAVGSSAVLADDFYEGKTITFIVGNAPGGGYDTYTRTTARHIGKHIPGNPSALVQNRTGAGGLVAANYVYSRAKPDGLTLGNWNNAKVLSQALGDRGIRFESDRFGWIGAPVKGFPACLIMGFTGLKTVEDVINSKKPLKMGATRAGSSTADVPKLLNRTMGTKFDVVSGYSGTATIRLAMQKREVDGACWGWESVRVTARTMLDAEGEDKLIPYVIMGDPKDPEVADLPRLRSLIKNKEKLAMVNAYGAVYEFQRPLMAPPGTPPERMEMLRKAYLATMNDPEFLADAKRSKLIIMPVSGAEIDKLVVDLLSISPDVKEQLQFLVRKTKQRN